MNIRQDLEENGYKAYEASISAFGSNYDRAVELYYYIKGGRVDYGAAHAAKYGHERYGKTYEGIYKDWKPGQKIPCWTQHGWSNDSSIRRIIAKWKP